MSKKEIMNQIKQFCIEKTQQLIAELEQKRFDNQGAFNGNDKWADNSPIVIADKGRNEPLVDSGALKSTLTNPANWNLNPVSTKSKLVLTIPKTEKFTPSKYDKLQTGGKNAPYISLRGNNIKALNLPARNFKNLSKQDADWVVQNLVRAIQERFA